MKKRRLKKRKYSCSFLHKELFPASGGVPFKTPMEYRKFPRRPKPEP
jgi:hypothetical protein